MTAKVFLQTATRAPRAFRRAGLAAVRSVYRQSLAASRRPERVEHRINALNLEPTKRCNEKCPMCPQPTLEKSEIGDMSFEQFEHIIDQFPHVHELRLQGLGEIFLNRDIWRMLQLCRERSIRVLFSTNGVLMDEHASRRLCELGDVDVRFSYDTLDNERYARIRGVDVMDRVQRNIRTFARVRSEHGRRHSLGWKPSAELRMVCMDENVHELPDMVRFAADAGIERVTASFILAKRHNEVQSDIVRERSAEITREGLGDVERRARETARQLGVKLKKMPYQHDILNTCDWPWRMPYITYDGYVTPCCHIESPKAGHLGNLLENTFEEIWNGEQYRSLRRNFTDLDKNHICRVCPYLDDSQVARYQAPPSASDELISPESLVTRSS